LSDAYYAVNADYHPGIDADKAISVEWARIPHFHYNFYVYKYATGISAAATLAKGLVEERPGARDAYIGFLKAGATKDVLDLLRDAGVDLESPEPVENTIALFAETTKSLAEFLE
jgi:oligoendopeptidase F